jgi:hypothetical protein
MNRLYHFGDSYATLGTFAIDKHFCGIIADELGYVYQPYGMAGLSNEQILNKILKNIFEFKENDILFINFSFFQRGCWYDTQDKIIKSTNKFYNEIEMKKTNYTIKEKNKILTLLTYYIEHSEDYARKIFKLYNSIFEKLCINGIKIYYIFNEETEFSDDLLKIGTNIKFENGFVEWLKVNNFHLQEDCHYTVGIQPMLADVILRKTKNFTNKECINIDINDIDLTKINKSTKLI